MENLLKLLANKGFRLTSQRKAVLETLVKSHRPMTLKQIHQQSRQIDFASIYRIIKLFRRVGIVDEVNLGDKSIHYEIQNDDHHHHIICERCHKIQRIDICLTDRISKLTDYKVVSHIMEFRGICPECSS